MNALINAEIDTLPPLPQTITELQRGCLYEDTTIKQVADIIGTSPATIYRYESNYITKMGVDKLTPIAKALHVSEAYLMGWTDDVSWLPNDEKLLSVIHQLSPEAQEKVLEYAEDLLASKRYSR